MEGSLEPAESSEGISVMVTCPGPNDWQRRSGSTSQPIRAMIRGNVIT